MSKRCEPIVGMLENSIVLSFRMMACKGAENVDEVPSIPEVRVACVDASSVFGFGRSADGSTWIFSVAAKEDGSKPKAATMAIELDRNKQVLLILIFKIDRH